MLITEEYREMNRALHKRKNGYGTSGASWKRTVSEIIHQEGIRTMLDYGCGKGGLRKALKGGKVAIAEYDPAIEGKDSPPKPAQLVTCTDVLEHIEPECLNAVLANIARLTERVAFLEICTRPAKKMLSDGRNAHLIVKQAKWWREKIGDYFDIQEELPDAKPDSAVFICTPKELP